MNRSLTRVRFENVTMEFPRGNRSVVALSNLSMNVQQGEFLVVVGPTGCGKSTLIHLLGGFLAPTSGSVRVDDKHVIGPGIDRVVLFQMSSLFPWLTVRRNLEYALRIQGVSAATRIKICNEMLAQTELTAFARSLPRELSGGMNKLAELGRALIARPQVLLLDEPLGSLDALSRQQVQALLQRLWMEQPTTVVLVTHDLEEAVFLADRVVVLSPRPGTVKAEIQIALRRPRLDADRVTPEFQALRENLFHMLAQISVKSPHGLKADIA